ATSQLVVNSRQNEIPVVAISHLARGHADIPDDMRAERRQQGFETIKHLHGAVEKIQQSRIQDLLLLLRRAARADSAGTGSLSAMLGRRQGSETNARIYGYFAHQSPVIQTGRLDRAGGIYPRS